MTANELIALLDHAVELLEESNKKLDKEFKKSSKNRKGGKNDGKHLSN